MPGGSVKMGHREFIDLVGDRLGVPKVFRDSIFGIESAGGKPNIQDSPKGAMGPGQLMPGTARLLGVNPRDPAQNIYGSLKLQKQLLDKYRKITGDEDKAWILAAAAYNAGEGAVQKHGGVPPYKETQNYVRMLAENMRRSRGSEAKEGGRGTSQAGVDDVVQALQKLGESVTKATRAIDPTTPRRPAKEPTPLALSNKPDVRPGSPILSASSPPVKLGLTPPTRTENLITDTAKYSQFTNFGIFSEDTRRSFFEGLVRAGGGLIADIGFLSGNKPSDALAAAGTTALLGPVGWPLYKSIYGQDERSKHPLQKVGEGLERDVFTSMERHKADTRLGRFRQSVARGSGAALVELPKLLGASAALGPATLPVLGGVSGARTGGPGGLVKGAAMGAVYHYGGQITGQYLSKVGNALFWTGAPAVEQHLVNGVPLEEALGEQIALGLYVGGSNNRAYVELPNGRVRPATPLDIPKIVSGRLRFAEPQQVVMSGAAGVARQKIQQAIGRFLADEAGSVKLPAGNRLSRLPKEILPDLTTLGAFHYEAGTRSFDDWMGRMLGELGETPESIRPQVARQLGEVYARSKAVYDNGTAPTFFSGLRQTVVELARGGLIGKEITNTERLVNLLRSRGQGEELEASGLLEELARVKTHGGKYTLEDVLSYLDTKGMTLEVMRGGESGRKHLLDRQVEQEEGGPGVLPGMNARGPYITPGGRDYFEGVIHSNKALDFSTDDVHFGFRPDQISWYRGQLMGERQELSRYELIQDDEGTYYIHDLQEHRTLPETETEVREEALNELRRLDGAHPKFTPEVPVIAILEEVQSKRAQRGREYGVTKDPDNAHSRLIALQREHDRVGLEAEKIERELGLSKWEATDAYSRYIPDESDYVGGLASDAEVAKANLEVQGMRERVKELDSLRAQLASLEHEIQNLEYYTDREAQIPWSPHLDTWYEPAVKGFLREAAERLEPDQEGNVRVTWTPASEQISRYGPVRKEINRILWSVSPENAGAWDVTVYWNDATRKLYTKSFESVNEKRLVDLFGKDIARQIATSEEIQDSIGLTPPLPMGGEWTVRLYGDTRENIQRLYPNKPELLDFAWTESGNKAILPAYLEKYAKAWGGRLSVPRDEGPRIYKDLSFEESLKVVAELGAPKRPYLVIPEAMRQMILKQGQLMFGRQLPALPKGKGYGVRNRITEEEAAQEARRLIAEKHKPVKNLFGDRVPNPSRREGGFIDVGEIQEAIDDLRKERPELSEEQARAVLEEERPYLFVPGVSREEEARRNHIDNLVEYVKNKNARRDVDMKRREDLVDEIVKKYPNVPLPLARRYALYRDPKLAARLKGDFGVQDIEDLVNRKPESTTLFAERMAKVETDQNWDDLQAAKEPITYSDSDVIDLTDQDVDIRSRIKNFLEDEEGTWSFGRKKKPQLDARVATDVSTRGVDTSSLGVFFRSPSRWMAGFKDARVDKIAERMFDAEVAEHDYVTEWGRRFSAIVDHLQVATLGRKPAKVFGKKADQEAMKTTFEDFVDLIEKPFEVDGPPLLVAGGATITPKIPNPDRRSSNPMIQRALEEHDALAQEFKDYLIDSYKSRGIDIPDPDNWGVTEKGYFRHLFPGEDNIFMDGNYMGTGETYLDAIVKANDLIQKNPQAQVEIRRRPVQFVDPSIRVSTKSFERLVEKLTGTINNGQQVIRAREIREDLVGTVGKKENIAKFFAASLKREGYEGYLKDYETVMRAHYFQLARSQELSKLRKDITPLLEELRREGMRGVVEGIERHLDDLWGKPVTYEKAVGGFIRKFPALRERIANPDLGLEIAVRKIAGLHNLLKLRYNPKAVFINMLQPLRTLWPYLTNKDMMEVVRRYRDPKWRQDMTELGVMSGAVKLETGGSKVEGFGAKEFLKDPFTYVSGHNRALGYTAGVIFAERSGLTGYDAHKMGMRWAAKVEFDNSKWDAPRFLRHSLGQLFGQYKGFLVKDIENTIDIFSKQASDSPWHPNLSRASRVGKWFIGTAVFGGLRATLSPLPWMGTALGYSIYLGTAALIKAMTDTSDKDAKFLASILFLGSPASAGLDLSASLTPIDDPPGISPWEKVGRFALGPTPSSLYDIGRASRQVVAPGKNEEREIGERLFNLGTKVSPYVRMVQRGYQLEQNLVHGKRQYMTVDRHRIPLTRTQMAFGAFGVPPSSQTLYYEEKEATGKSPLSKKRGPSPFGDPTRGLLTPKVFKPIPQR